jgi:hypothetical protein
MTQTPMQTIFPKKPKEVISPLTPPDTADAIRAKYAKPAPEPTEAEVAMQELEALAADNALRRTRSRKP